MAHTHEGHGHDAGAGLAVGTMLIAAIVLAGLIALIVLLVAQPWDDEGGGGIDIPAIEEPVGGDEGGGGRGGEPGDGQ